MRVPEAHPPVARSKREDLSPYCIEVVALTPRELERARSTCVVFPQYRLAEGLF